MGTIVCLAILVLPVSFWLGEARPAAQTAVITAPFYFVDGIAHQIVDKIENLPDVQYFAFEPLRKIMEIFMQLQDVADMGFPPGGRSSNKKRKSVKSDKSSVKSDKSSVKSDKSSDESDNE